MAAADSRSWVTVPAPIRELFKLFPLQVYDPEELPYRAPDTRRSRPALYIFAREGDGDRPSFNPSCLKWQTFLRIAGVDVDLIPSNNHASPSGALPFLLSPSTAPNTRSATPLTGDKIRLYASQNASQPIPSIETIRLEAYQSLLSQAIRPAWLHALYINPSNAHILHALYLPASSLPLAYSLHQTLIAAATTEILKTARTSHLRPAQLYADAKNAFDALDTLLGDDAWFFGAAQPSLFDAEVFAYTWLILDYEGLDWQRQQKQETGEKGPGGELQNTLAGAHKLIAHRQRLYQRCWGEAATAAGHV